MNVFNIISGQKKSLLRDPMAVLMVFIPFIILLLVKKVLPIFLQDSFTHFIYMMVYLITPSLLGMMLGLMLTDEKDEDVFSYISVTTLGVSGYLAIKLILGVLFSIILNSILALFLEEHFYLNLLFTIILSSMLVPYYGILIFQLSKDKVEALTRGKLFSFILFAAVIPYFFESKFTWFLCMFPTFWLEKIYDNGSYTLFSFIYLICGSIVAVITMVVTNFLSQSR